MVSVYIYYFAELETSPSVDQCCLRDPAKPQPVQTPKPAPPILLNGSLLSLLINLLKPSILIRLQPFLPVSGGLQSIYISQTHIPCRS